MESYYTIETASYYFNCSTWLIRKWIRLGRLKQEKISDRRIRISSTEIHKLYKELKAQE